MDNEKRMILQPLYVQEAHESIIPKGPNHWYKHWEERRKRYYLTIHERFESLSKFMLPKLRAFSKDVLKLKQGISKVNKPDLIDHITFRFQQLLWEQDFKTYNSHIQELNKVHNAFQEETRILKEHTVVSKLSEACFTVDTHEWPLAKPLILGRSLTRLYSPDLLGNNSVVRVIHWPIHTGYEHYILVFAIRTKHICEQFERFLSENAAEIDKVTKAEKKYVSKNHLTVPKEENPELQALIEKCPRITLRREDLVAYEIQGVSFTAIEAYSPGSNHFRLDQSYSNEKFFISTTELPKGVHYLLQAFQVSSDPNKWAQWKMRHREYSIVSVDLVKQQFFNKSNDSEVESLDIILSLKCPITLQRMERPVRGADCKHLACIDERSFNLLFSNNDDKENGAKCPLCSELLDDLVVCGYTLEILCKSGSDEVIIDAKTGEWKAVPLTFEDEEGGE